MAQKTEIGWCDSTINGSSGCDGCELYQPPATELTGDDLKAWLQKWPCYAAHVHQNRLATSFPENYAPSFHHVRMIPGRFAQAASWSDLRGKERPDKPWLSGKPRHIFVGDMGDFLSDDVTDEFLECELLGAITSEKGKRHAWMLLTKRPARLATLSEKWGGLPDNVIAMTTATSQRTADLRIPELLKVRCKWRGLSLEPLWTAIDLNAIHDGTWLYAPLDGERVMNANGASYDSTGKIQLVIAGCESGPKRRPMDMAWIHSLNAQCQAASACFFLKQAEQDGKVTTGPVPSFRQFPNILP